MRMGAGTGTGSGRVEERRRNARNRTRNVDVLRHFHSAIAGVALAGTQKLRLQGPVPVHAHRT